MDVVRRRVCDFRETRKDLVLNDDRTSLRGRDLMDWYYARIVLEAMLVLRTLYIVRIVRDTLAGGFDAFTVSKALAGGNINLGLGS
jgi:hypothetical protein